MLRAAVEAVEAARQLSPFDPMLYAMCAARACALFRLERFEEAGEWALKATRQPNAHLHAHALSPSYSLASEGWRNHCARPTWSVACGRPTLSMIFLVIPRLSGTKEPGASDRSKQIGIA